MKVAVVPIPREESSAVTAIEGHSDMLFDAAHYASEAHLVDRYRARLGPIFDDVLHAVKLRFLDGYKVRNSLFYHVPKRHPVANES